MSKGVSNPTTLLIAGRGPLALLAAKLAAGRGYRTTLLLDKLPDPSPMVLGHGREGPGFGLFEAILSETGLGEGAFADLPPLHRSLLYVGTIHRILGPSFPSVSLTPEEEGRFFPGTEPLIRSVLPELDRRIDGSWRSTSTRGGWTERLLTWVFEPERHKETLPKKLRAMSEGLLDPWRPLLEDLGTFVGMGEGYPDDPEFQRVLLALVLGRTGRLSPGYFPDLEDHGALASFLSGIRIERFGGIPWQFEKKGRRGLVVYPPAENQPPVIVDRILDLMGPSERDPIEGTCTVELASLPDRWPSLILFSGPSALLDIPTISRRDGQAEARVLLSQPTEAPEATWNRAALCPFVVPGSFRPVPARIGGLKAVEGSIFPRTHRKGAFLSAKGPLSVMTDPSLIGMLPEDWLADLSMAIPKIGPPAFFDHSGGS